MSSYPLVKYVDAPATTAVVRYDFNDQAATPAKKVTEFDPGVPTLEGDPDAVGQSWGFRSPQIVHTIKGTKAQAMAALSAVSKEQLRRTNWVLFKPSAAQQPVWFKTYATGYQPISLEQVWVRPDGGGQVALPDTWKITVPLVADAFAYGARETIPTVQMVQSPADLAGPTRYAMKYALPAIKGDAPTPLRVTITPDTATGVSSPETAWLVGCVSGSAAMSEAVAEIGTGDGFTGGTVATTDASSWFNGSHRTFSVAAGPGTFSILLSGPLPNLPFGRYKVVMRNELDGSTTLDKEVLFKFGTVADSNSEVAYGQTATVTNPANSIARVRRGWADLGEFSVPASFAVTSEAITGLPTLAAGTNQFKLQVAVPDGTATTFRLDAFRFIPVGGPDVAAATFLATSWPYPNYPGYFSSTTTTNAVTWDGDAEVSWITASGGTVGLVGSSQTLKGGFPVADPAAAVNWLYAIAADHGRTAATATTTVTVTSRDSLVSVDISYYPRFLYVGDGT